MSIASPQEFEVFEDRVIGNGETGILCHGRQIAEGRRVTIKLLGERMGASPEDLAQCHREIELLDPLKSDHVHRVLGSGVWKKRTFFALESLEGELLSRHLQEGNRFSTDEILHVGEGVARALQAAWSSGIVHGAIRPSNVFLTSDGTVKVSGFGTKRCLEVPPESPTYLVSLRYLSPEQWLSRPLDVRSDLYSLGVVLYELATGKPPFDGFDSATSLHYQMAYVEPPSPRQRGALIPPELDRLILRCLEKSPEKRCETPEKFMEELSAIRSAAKKGDRREASTHDLGDFELFEEQVLGEGGMGTLYRGRQRSLGRPVAIKVIRGIFTENPECVQRFRREAELLAQVNDPAVVQVFGTGIWKGRLFYAMELVEGADLATTLNRGRKYRYPEILDIAQGVARALQAAWTYKIVHRDIKPSNVLITPDQRTKVADFGLAKSLRIPRAQSRLIAGTSEYLSPEQAVGQNVDIRSDLYSLGVVMYELVSGRTPFKSEGSLTGVVYQHVYYDPPPLKNLVPDVPPALARMIHRCLSKNPEERYADPLHFLEELKTLRRELVGSSSARLVSPQVSRFRKAGRFCRRSLASDRGTAAFIGLVGLLLFLAATVRRDPDGASSRKTYELAIELGDYPSALRIAEQVFGRSSPEYRAAEIGVRESDLVGIEKEARAWVRAQDWENAAACYRQLQAGSGPERRPIFVQAEEYCRALASARRLEGEGQRAAALRVYRELQGRGSLHEAYLSERVEALRRAEVQGPP